MQATSGLPSASWQPSASGQAPASQAAQAQAALQDQLNQSQSLNLALRQPRIVPNHPKNHIPPAPTPKAPTPIELFSPDAHPTDPFRTQHQRGMMDAFIAHQRWGLRGYILEEARRRWASIGKGSTSCSWYAIIEDEEVENTYYTFNLLMQLPDCIIKSLIQNTLAFDYANDREVKAFVNRRMKTSVAYAGIYVNIPTRSLSPGGLALSGVPGKGEFLSSEEAERLIQRVERYIANKPADHTENSKVDYYFRPLKSASELGKRRFSGEPPNPRWEEWLKEFRSIYCNNVPASERSTRFQRCPMEVGWSQNISKRLKDHRNNDGTTAIFGVVNAMTRQPTTQEGFGFPEVWQLALFPVWERDPKLARVAEVVGSILCSSYWCYGGLNIMEAGYSNITTSTPDFKDILWEESIREACKRFGSYGLVDEDVQFWLDGHRMVEAERELPQSKADATSAKAENKEAVAKRTDLGSRLKRKSDEREDLDRQIKSQHRQIDYQQGRKDEGQYQSEDSLRVWDELHTTKSQREKDLAPLFDFDTDMEDRPRIDKSTLAEPTKSYLARLEANIQAEKEKWLKDQ
ncbi:hypothetical protein JMJ35_005920 [Cladonia borealis]|uniref:Uncharacterized protein n=1 Tax=Cladonia borealis TaxID=184061 RepID=A0AA39V0U6_9LECA|nr:hypothetical protein JMJ35_005920 [Cladonia borealis]